MWSQRRGIHAQRNKGEVMTIKRITIREALLQTILQSPICPDSNGSSHSCPRCLTEQLYAMLMELARALDDDLDTRKEL